MYPLTRLLTTSTVLVPCIKLFDQPKRRSTLRYSPDEVRVVPCLFNP